MKKKIKRLWDIITWILVGLTVLLAVLLVGVRLLGLQVFTVLSGSMEPTYHVGSMIYVREVNYKKLEAGDVITYMAGEDVVVTHRIAGIVPDEADPDTLRFRTKGDANDTEDGSLVHYKNIIGSPLFSIPYLGYLSDYIQKPPGMYVAISTGAILILLVFLPDVFSSGEKEKGKKEAETDKE